MKRRVGILAVQGDVRQHALVLDELGADVQLVRKPGDVQALDGLVLPGGESTVIDKLTRALGLREPLIEAIGSGMPVLGTCAGLILLAERVLDAAPGQQSLGGLDIDVRRNAFGSQVDSFEGLLTVPSFGSDDIPVAFIRAPIVERVGQGVRVLAEHDGRVVAVQRGAITGLAFHPEVVGERRFHRMMVE